MDYFLAGTGVSKLSSAAEVVNFFSFMSISSYSRPRRFSSAYSAFSTREMVMRS